MDFMTKGRSVKFTPTLTVLIVELRAQFFQVLHVDLFNDRDVRNSREFAKRHFFRDFTAQSQPP